MRRVIGGLCVVLAFSACAGAAGVSLTDLESGKSELLDGIIRSSPSGNERNYYLALKDFYAGRLAESQADLVSVSTPSFPPAAWLKNYLAEIQPLQIRMETAESEHFIVKALPKEKFLSRYALSALEKAYQRIGSRLGNFPDGKMIVEIYPDQQSFSAASTLSKETLDRSGAIGICKFRRLMILSPEQLAFGYPWLDTLSHEYTHFLVNRMSSARCPLWLHEGIARYFETVWREDEPQFMNPGSRTELVKAGKEGQLISFSRMEPSMVYLDDQEQVSLAFSEVAHAVHFITALKAEGAVRNILLELAAGKTRDESFRSVLGLSSSEFESRWREFLKNEDLQESPGAMTGKVIVGKADELEELIGTNIRGHVRLGDRFRMNGKSAMALVQYDKALKLEPSNPVVLTKSARVLLSLGQGKEALGRLEDSMRENPAYAPAFLLFGAESAKKGQWRKAYDAAFSANAVNPFDPEAHRIMAESAENLGKSGEAASERAVWQSLGQQ
jgi:tetratricopeptide (TPR) repeat protein